jgi:phosphomevalonate kinase
MPWFDASALRGDGRKLGLGSSAAILVAALGALAIDRDRGALLERVRDRVFAKALPAHRKAQGGGSGIDVAASVYGGILSARLRSSGELELSPIRLPPDLQLGALVSGHAASTAELIAKVKAFGAEQPERHASIFAQLAAAAAAALTSAQGADAPGMIKALDAQCAGLGTLGEVCGANIVTDAVRQLQALAHRQNACVLPAGAGGGDIVLFAGTSPMSEEFEALASQLAHERVDLHFGARGLEREHEREP